MKKLLLLVFAILFIGVGIFLRIYANEMAKKCTVETSATVVRIIEKEDYDDGERRILYYPVFEYKVGENTITKEGNSGSNPSFYSVGDKIDILYNSENANEYLIKGDNTMKIVSIVLIVIGVIMILWFVKSIIFGS